MKKFYTLLTLCLAFFGIATATAQNAPELSNEKAYTVKNTRSAWATSAEALKTISDLGISEDAADANQQFAFLTNDEGETYYLYSVGQQKFINNDGTLSATADFPINFKKGNAEGTFVAYFDGSHYVNIGGSNQMIIDGWSSADAGNSNVFTIAADFDPTEALKALPAPVVPEYPFIKSVSELSNNKLYTVVQKSHSKGATSWAIATGGDAFVSSKQVEGAVAGQADDTKQQFAFLTYEEKIYLYHPAEKKFVNKDASLSATPVDAITLLDGAFKNTFMVKFDDSHYVNVNGEQNMGIDGWSAADGGNSCTISAVADFDPTEVLKLFIVPTTIENAGGVNGQICTTTSSLEITFSAPIAKVNVVAFQSMFGEFPPMTEGTDYTFNENVLKINVPTQYLENAANVPEEYRVLILALNVEDANGNIVTYSNSTYYPQEAAEQMGMSFLQYAVVPPATIENAGGVEGSISTSTSSLEITFSAPIAKVNVVAFQSMFGEFPPMVEGTDYSFNENVLTINVPTQYLENAVNVPEEYRVLILALNVEDAFGNIVTYSNSTYYPQEAAEQMNMSFLQYAVVPPATIENAGGVEGKISTSTSNLEITFSAPIAKVNVVAFQSMFGEFPPMVEGTDYYFYGNVLSINVPTQYLENAANVPEEYRVLILALNVEDAFGNIVTYSNSTYYPQEAAEQMNMSFLQYAVIPATKVVAISPECGKLEEGMPASITLTFTDEIKALEFGQLRTNATGRAGYTFTEEDYTIAGKELTLNLPENLVAGQPNLNITLSVADKNGMYVTYASNPDYATDGYITLEYTAPIKADFFAMESSDPAAGNVEKLDVINVTFGTPNYTPQFPGQTQIVGGIDATKEVAVVDAEGNVVTTATMEIVQANGWNSNTVKFTLATPITEVGAYTLVIPAATVYNEMYDEYAEDFGVNWGAIYNPEVRIAYTIAAPDGINNITVNGNVEVYTLDGRKVKNPTKGIYVVNGKKVYVK